MIKNYLPYCTIAAICITLGSCAGLKQSQQALQLDKSYCNKQPVTIYSKAELPKPFHELKLDTILTNRFSNQSLNIANAISLLDLLSNYINLSLDYHSHPSIDKRINLMERSQQINQKINIASLEISAVASELDCEEERANQFAYYLKEKEGRAEQRLIIGSIIIGAAGAIAAEIISNNSSSSNFASGLTIGVSITEATLGVLMLLNKKKIGFYHKDNALADIWTNAVISNYFPPSIWYYLTYENPKKNEKSLARLLVDKWVIFGQISNDKDSTNNKAFELYFGQGGKYRADELKNRADMLDQTEAYVALMKQDLKTLAYEVEKLLYK